MKLAASLISCILLLGTGISATAQQRLPSTTMLERHATTPEPFSSSSAPQHLQSAEPAAQMEELAGVALAASLQPRRSLWRYPMIGAVVGAVAGAAWGAYVMATTEEYLAPPAYLVTVPLGAALGALLGIAANAIDPPT